ANVLEHAFGALGELSGGLQFEIFVERFRGARRRNHFARLGVGGGFVNEIYAPLVVRFLFGGIGGDRLVEGRIGLVHLAAVGQHRALVVVILRRAGRIERCRLVIGLDRLFQLTGAGFSLAQIVVISGQALGVLGLGAGFHDLLFEVNRFLVIGNRVGITLGLLRCIGLFRSRTQVRISQPGPEQVPRGIHLRGFVKSVHRGFEITGLHGLVGYSKFLVQDLDRVGLLGSLGLLLLHLLQL